MIYLTRINYIYLPGPKNEFLRKTEGSAIRRIGYECWLRNIAVALGNAPFDENIVNALQTRAQHPSALVSEHVEWALECQRLRKT